MTMSLASIKKLTKGLSALIAAILLAILLLGCDTTRTYNEYSYWRWEQMERDAEYEPGGRMYQ